MTARADYSHYRKAYDACQKRNDDLLRKNNENDVRGGRPETFRVRVQGMNTVRVEGMINVVQYRKAVPIDLVVQVAKYLPETFGLNYYQDLVCKHPGKTERGQGTTI